MAVAHIGPRLSVLRLAHGCRQNQLSVATGVTKSLISRLEHGRLTGTISVAEKLARFFAVPMGYFLKPIGEGFAEEVFLETRSLSPLHRQQICCAVQKLSLDHAAAVEAIQGFLPIRRTNQRTAPRPPQPRPDTKQSSALARKEAACLLAVSLRNGGPGKMWKMIGNSTRERAEIQRAFGELCRERKIPLESLPHLYTEPQSVCPSAQQKDKRNSALRNFGKAHPPRERSRVCFGRAARR
jgi:transcriptional regulator with XRE-family HTH domain